MTNATNRNRVQAGVPTGGEFATQARDENPDLEVPGTRPGLNAVQERLLSSAESVGPITFADGSVYEPGLLVSGNEYKTALALERRGYGTVRYQGPSMGWLHANKPEETE